MSIEDEIRRYIYKSIDRLRKQGDKVQLKCVYPNIITYVLKDEGSYNFIGGYGANYSIEVGKYKICGSMQFGIATITLMEDK